MIRACTSSSSSFEWMATHSFPHVTSHSLAIDHVALQCFLRGTQMTHPLPSQDSSAASSHLSASVSIHLASMRPLRLQLTAIQFKISKFKSKISPFSRQVVISIHNRPTAGGIASPLPLLSSSSQPTPRVMATEIEPSTSPSMEFKKDVLSPVSQLEAARKAAALDQQKRVDEACARMRDANKQTKTGKRKSIEERVEGHVKTKLLKTTTTTTAIPTKHELKSEVKMVQSVSAVATSTTITTTTDENKKVETAICLLGKTWMLTIALLLISALERCVGVHCAEQVCGRRSQCVRL